MSEIKKLKERMIIYNNLVNEDAINSANNFNELTKQCEHLKNGWKESQQNYELQTNEYREVLAKLKEYELLLNEAKGTMVNLDRENSDIKEKLKNTLATCTRISK